MADHRQSEWFPKEGYGWFLAFMTVLVLPSPIAYFYYKDTRKINGNDASQPIDSEVLEENPLSKSSDQLLSDQSTTYDVERSELRDIPPSRIKLAKMRR